MINEQMRPHRPQIIMHDLEVHSYFYGMNTSEVILELINGQYVLIEDYYSDGLLVLEALKNQLKTNFRDSFQGQRDFRYAYREASNRLLLMISDHNIMVRKSPKIGWLNILYPEITDFLISFPAIQGLNSSWQWYVKGIRIDVLGIKIHPYYGIYFPTRFDHLELFNSWLKRYTGDRNTAIDVGIGSGILSFQLLQKGFENVIGTDTNINAIIGANLECERLHYKDRLRLIHGDLFANCDAKADVIVFNPPWLIAKHELNEGIDKAIYYEKDLFVRFFDEAGKYLNKNGKLVIIFSNLADEVQKDNIHPIKTELNINNCYRKELYLEQNVRSSSNKTRRKNWRKNEKVELWVLIPNSANNII